MVSEIKSRWETYFGGILLVCIVAAAATFLAEHYGAPAILFAPLIGVAFYFMSQDDKVSPGVEVAARTNQTYSGAAIADATFARSCSKTSPTVRPTATKRSFSSLRIWSSLPVN